MTSFNFKSAGVQDFIGKICEMAIIDQAEGEKLGLDLSFKPDSDHTLSDHTLRASQMSWLALDDDDAPLGCLHGWLSACDRYPLQYDKWVQYRETSYWLILDCVVDLDSKFAAILTFDIYEQQAKIICFR